MAGGRTSRDSLNHPTPMVKAWFVYLFHQLSAALSFAALILITSEVLIPGSILPYFNLHALIVIAVIIAMCAPAIGSRSIWTKISRGVLLLAVSIAVLGYAYLLFGTSVSGLALLAALALALVALIVIVSSSGKEDEELEQPKQSIEEVIVVEESVIINESEETLTIDTETETVEVEIDETSVFMR